MRTIKKNDLNSKLSKQYKALAIYSWEREKRFLHSTQQVVS